MPRRRLCWITATIALVPVTAVAASETAAMGSVRVPSANSLPSASQLPTGPRIPGLPKLPAAPTLPSNPFLPTLPSAPSLLPLPDGQYASTPSVPTPASPFATLPAGSQPQTTGSAAGQRGPVSPPRDAGQVRAGLGLDARGDGYLLQGNLRVSSSAVTRIRAAREARRLRATLTNLNGCLYSLTGLERRVLVLLAGLKRRRAYSRTEVAARLDLSRERVGRIKRRGLRRLRTTARADGCAAGAAASVKSTSPAFGALPSPSGPIALVRPLVARGAIPFSTPGQADLPFTPPLPEELPDPVDATGIGATWVIVLLALGGLVFFALVARELRRARDLS